MVDAAVSASSGHSAQSLGYDPCTPSSLRP